MGVAAVACSLSLAATVASAQERVYVDVDRAPRQPIGFIEATGGYGVQMGETDYLPDGALDEYQHPLVNGYAVGGTAGLFVSPLVSLIANYEYTEAWSRNGEIPGLLDEVQGEIDYHTITGGVRLRAPVGFGALRAELAVGVVLPYETELRFDYGPVVAQLGLTGTGTRVEHFSTGFGGHGALGYEIPLGDMFYLALDVKMKVFQSDNSGESTEYRNMVTDFDNPVPVTATVEHDDGAERPITSSVQSTRGHLTLGARF